MPRTCVGRELARPAMPSHHLAELESITFVEGLPVRAVKARLGEGVHRVLVLLAVVHAQDDAELVERAAQERRLVDDDR